MWSELDTREWQNLEKLKDSKHFWHGKYFNRTEWDLLWMPFEHSFLSLHTSQNLISPNTLIRLLKSSLHFTFMYVK